METYNNMCQPHFGLMYENSNYSYNSNYNPDSVTIPSSIMQLAAYGAIDTYLTGNPQITYWRMKHSIHTNFGIEGIEESFSNSQIDYSDDEIEKPITELINVLEKADYSGLESYMKNITIEDIINFLNFN